MSPSVVLSAGACLEQGHMVAPAPLKICLHVFACSLRFFPICNVKEQMISDDNMAIKYTICVILMIKLDFFLDNNM